MFPNPTPFHRLQSPRTATAGEAPRTNLISHAPFIPHTPDGERTYFAAALELSPMPSVFPYSPRSLVIDRQAITPQICCQSGDPIRWDKSAPLCNKGRYTNHVVCVNTLIVNINV